MHDPRANEVSKLLFTRYNGVIVVSITRDTAFSLRIKAKLKEQDATERALRRRGCGTN